MAALDQMDKRNAARAQIIADSRKLKPAVITDDASVKEHIKLVKDMQTDLIDKCFLVTEDFAVIRRALFAACQRVNPPLDPNQVCEDAWGAQRFDAETEEIMNKRKHDEQVEKDKEAAKREKEAAKKENELIRNGKVPEVPGQQKMFDPEKMQSAEAAGPVTVTKLEAVK